jgi:hypothetical protein
MEDDIVVALGGQLDLSIIRIGRRSTVARKENEKVNRLVFSVSPTFIFSISSK